MEIGNIPIVWISIVILGACFLTSGFILSSIARVYSGLVITVSAAGFLFLSWNMMIYGWILLVIATSLLGFGCAFSGFVKDTKATTPPPDNDD